MSDVDPADLPSRFRMAVAQVGRDSLAPQLSSASWFAVARRALVLTVIFAAGLVTHELSVAIFAAFGALQLGLLEAALPRLGLLRLLVVNVVALSLAAFAAAALGGTWWTVPLLGALAFITGANASSGLLPMATSLGALTIAVIFAGLPDASQHAGRAALGFAVGAAIQSCAWLVTATTERRRTVRRLLANNVRAAQRLLRGGQVNGWQSHSASLDSERTASALAQSGLPDAQRTAAAAVVAATSDLHRSVVAWRVLKDPGWVDRELLDQSLHRSVHDLDESLRSRTQVAPVPRFASRTWACDTAVLDALAGLQTATVRLDTAWTSHGEAPHSPSERETPPESALPEVAESSPTTSAGPPTDSRNPTLWADLRVAVGALRPGSALFRHGVRLSVAIMAAQALALLMGVGHAFWIPLTVVFVVKPDWAFTVVRSTSRFLGNLAAVVLIPLLLLPTHHAPWTVAVVLCGISAVAFRYFSGNYVAASFGVAGTILVLDQTLDPDPSLYGWRVLATVLGTVIGLLAAVAIPNYRSSGLRDRIGALTASLGDWSRQVFGGLLSPATVDRVALLDQGRRLRSELLELIPRAAAALTEPWPRTDPRLQVAAVEAAQRAHLIMTALAFHAVTLSSHDRPGLMVADTAEHAVATLDQATAQLTSKTAERWVAPREATEVLTPEDIAVMAQATHVAQAADDLLAAIIGPTGDRAPG